MKRTLLFFSLLCGATLASAQTLEPAQGFSFGETTVRILRGNGAPLVDNEVACESKCSGATCAVHVLFGAEEGDVEHAAAGAITVIAPPQPAGTVVDVTIKAPGRADVVLPHAFTYRSDAIATAEDYVAYLVPLTKSLPGANGSLWAVEQQFYNAGDFTFLVPGTVCTLITSPPCFGPMPLFPGATTTLSFVEGVSDTTDGAYVYIPKDADLNVTSQLRVRNTSAGDTNWGTEIPIVRLSDFRERVHVLDIPTDPRFRATLRIYGGTAPATAHVRVMRPNQSQPVEERDVELQGIVEIVPNPFPNAPAYAQLDLLTDAVRAAGPRVYVEVTTPVQGLKLWAFVSLTNNVTQQVTAITPHLTQE